VKKDFSKLALMFSPSFELQIFGGNKQDGLFFGSYSGFSEVFSQIQSIYEHLEPQSFEVYDLVQFAPGKLLFYVFITAHLKSDLNKTFPIRDGFPCMISYEMKPSPILWDASEDERLPVSSPSLSISSTFPSTSSQKEPIAPLPVRFDFAITMCQEWMAKDRVYSYARMMQLYIPRRKRRLSLTHEEPQPAIKKRLLLLSSEVTSISSSSSLSSSSSSSSSSDSQYCESQ
jgi:hypothetical protein